MRLSLRVPETTRARFTTPGQYVPLQVGQARGYFAIASGPGEPELEFLVKRGHAAADALAGSQVGDVVELGEVSGKGFPLEASKGRDLVLVATGTGSAPMRAVLSVVSARRGDWGSVVFVHGVRTVDDAGWHDDAHRWRDANIDWRLVVSQVRPDHRGLTGHVQTHLGALGHPRATAFLCGQKEMTDEVTRQLVAMGLPPAQVFLNV